MRVIVEVRPRLSRLVLKAMAIEEEAVVAMPLATTGFDPDPDFVVLAPKPRREPAMETLSFAQETTMSMSEPEVSALIRGTIPDDDPEGIVLRDMNERHDVVAVFSDPQIETTPIGPGDPAAGTDADVAELLERSALESEGLTGAGVPVAVVDTGINHTYLRGNDRTNGLDAANSFTPKVVTSSPGQHPLGHGTMCAFDVGIAAPEATLLDHAVLLSMKQGKSAMEGLLSDAVLSYAQLVDFLNGQPEDSRRLVVNNSWGMYSPSWDFPVGTVGNYSDNARHPFNLIVGTLEDAGADILFAAGNCGREGPAAKCEFSELPICGANSHPDVLSVAGVDIGNERVAYSSQGPGRLDPEKPDISAYTHFRGSGVSGVDSGTSAACPVLAGVIAAVRTRYGARELAPPDLRRLLKESARDLGAPGYDPDYGWGVVDTKAVLGRLP